MELPCLDGHPKCFIITQICVFSLNSCGHTHPCRNGGHMEECSDFECTTKFKCTNSYCIPWTYVCDNKWDCPKGEDELFQHICGTNKSICVGMFRCWKTLSCIHSGSVCDGYIDCPSGDDEQFCQLKTIQCPEQCFCLAFVILCQEDHTELILYPVVAIKITNSPHVIQYIDKFKVCIILEIQNSNISDKDMPFHVSAPLLCLHIQHNKLRTIPPNSFCENVVLKTLNLSWNQIQVLLSESFNCLRGLVLLPCQVILWQGFHLNFSQIQNIGYFFQWWTLHSRRFTQTFLLSVSQRLSIVLTTKSVVWSLSIQCVQQKYLGLDLAISCWKTTTFGHPSLVYLPPYCCSILCVELST